MSNENGGFAFPTYEYKDKYGQMMAVGGMTLRDYFAAKAMQGFWSSGRAHLDKGSVSAMAEKAYEQANAMLLERSK